MAMVLDLFMRRIGLQARITWHHPAEGVFQFQTCASQIGLGYLEASCGFAHSVVAMGVRFNFGRKLCMAMIADNTEIGEHS